MWPGGAGLCWSSAELKSAFFRYRLLPSLVKWRGKSDRNIGVILSLGVKEVSHWGYELQRKESLKMLPGRPHQALPSKGFSLISGHPNQLETSPHPKLNNT